MVILSNFQPRRREISAVTNALNSVFTTTEDHGYELGQLVRVIVPKEYGMTIDYVEATIVALPADDQFTTDLDTSALATFVAPSAPPAFTSAQVVPISGTTDNETSITG